MVDSFEIEQDKINTPTHKFIIQERLEPSIKVYPASDREKLLASFDAEEVSHPAPQDFNVEVFNAKLLFEHNEYYLCLRLLQKILIRQPFHSLALELTGQCFFKLGKFDQSLVAFKQYWQSYKSASAAYWLAQVYYVSGQDAAALDYYTRSLTDLSLPASQLFEIYKNVGNIHCRAGDFDAAEEFYNKAYTVNPDSDTLLVNYGLLAVQNGNIELAKERFRQALSCNLRNDKAWAGLAMVHNQMGDFDLAWANIVNAVEIDPSNRTSMQLVAQWSIRDGRLYAAAEHLSNYLAIQNDDYEISYLLSQIFCAQSLFSLALIEVERCLSIQFNYEPALKLYEELKNHFKKNNGEAV